MSVQDNAKNIDINREDIEALEKGFRIMEKELTQDRLDNAIFQTDVKNGFKDLSTIKKYIISIAVSTMGVLIAGIIALVAIIAQNSNIMN